MTTDTVLKRKVERAGEVITGRIWPPVIRTWAPMITTAKVTAVERFVVGIDYGEEGLEI